jgi:hypothetical protein
LLGVAYWIMEYKILTEMYIGLTHGKGAPHYSQRELWRLYKISKINQFPITIIPAIGYETENQEDTLICKLIFPSGEYKEISKYCEAYNDFINKIFKHLHQRWILVNFTTIQNGTSVRADTINIDQKKRPRIKIQDLIPETSYEIDSEKIVKPKYITVSITIPIYKLEKKDNKLFKITTDELANKYGGGTIHNSDEYKIYELDFLDNKKNKLWLRNYIHDTLLNRFRLSEILIRYDTYESITRKNSI